MLVAESLEVYLSMYGEPRIQTMGMRLAGRYIHSSDRRQLFKGLWIRGMFWTGKHVAVEKLIKLTWL